MQKSVNEIKARRRQYLFGLVFLIASAFSGYFLINDMFVAAVSSVLAPFILIAAIYLGAIYQYSQKDE
ncbi:hypothetical protein TUM3792_42790 [Shewanella sp. MBTL60-007]|nr:hypothetical protein TUM3792_42790 [Shewanella sp. MBTL60-007]